MRLILDIETTRQRLEGKPNGDGSPYNPKNKLVTVQYKVVGAEDKECLVFEHKEALWEDAALSTNKLSNLLASATLIIGHNLKFDMAWLYECGFTIPKDCKLHDTMIFEYICAKGMKTPLGLADLAIKYELPHKLDILQDYWEKGVNTDEIPLAELTEYALADITTTEALYNHQRKKYSEDADVQYMYKAIELSNKALECIIEMERNGISIDQESLNEVKVEYIKELTILERGINEMVNTLMGDTPINLSSPDDMSKLLYSIEVNDKKKWAEVFGIGTDERNSVKKKRIPKRYSPTEFKKLIKEHSTKVYKTTAQHCEVCNGSGRIRKKKIDGTDFKREGPCKICGNTGFIYISRGSLAGLRLKPISSFHATAAGFAGDKGTIEYYLKNECLNEEEKAFLKALSKYSAITTYLSTFVEGINNNVRENSILHTSLNQCVTATGRLSSSNPNFQNLPRGSTFPVRKAIRSRFSGGNILEVDFAGLEYRVAVMLAECSAGLSSILTGKDRHQVTAEIIFGKKKEEYTKEEWKEVRQEAKAHTFKPLYGGESGSDAEVKYYKAFMEEHKGIKEWHEKLCNEAIETGQVKTPTHRIFSFPFARRQPNGRVKGKTQIVNYPVQSVATADLIWIVIYDIFTEMKAAKVKSKLILQVHDAVLIDVHPEEKELMIKLVKKSFDKVHDLMYTYYEYKTEVPITSEMSIGTNWFNKQEVKGIEITAKTA